MGGPLPAPSVDASTETVYVLAPTRLSRVNEVFVLLAVTVISFCESVCGRDIHLVCTLYMNGFLRTHVHEYMNYSMNYSNINT